MGGLGLAASTWYLLTEVGGGPAGEAVGGDVGRTVAAVLADPVGLAVALAGYAAAFWLRAWAWHRVQPEVSRAHAWAGLHVGLLGNHVLPLRLGEALRPLSAARRARVSLPDTVAATLALRGLDLLAVLGLACLAAPAVLADVAGPAPLVAATVGLGAVVLVGALLLGRRGGRLRRPDAAVVGTAGLAWVLEAAVVWQVARVAGAPLSWQVAIAVTAVTIAAQVIAVTPGGFGSYEAAATAALVGLGVPAPTAFAIALTTHGVKTAYALVLGAVSLGAPAPAIWGPARLPRARPSRPPRLEVEPSAPVVVVIPVYDEEATVGDVVARVPRRCAGRSVEVIVIDDGSADSSAAKAADAGARVVRLGSNAGLGAAVRRALAEACALRPAAVVYLDADGEYQPEQVPDVAAPVLAGDADYVVGSRFTGEIGHMLARRRWGNRALTRWLRWMARTPLTDGQSGFRAFSPAAAADAEIGHDYNYAQVLTLDLLAKGYRYAEVPIRYRFRTSGASFVRPGTYLRCVVPAVRRELASPARAQSSTTWAANLARAAAHAAGSGESPSRSAATAS